MCFGEEIVLLCGVNAAALKVTIGWDRDGRMHICGVCYCTVYMVPHALAPTTLEALRVRVEVVAK